MALLPADATYVSWDDFFDDYCRELARKFSTPLSWAEKERGWAIVVMFSRYAVWIWLDEPLTAEMKEYLNTEVARK